jgi:hypothetical protein
LYAAAAAAAVKREFRLYKRRVSLESFGAGDPAVVQAGVRKEKRGKQHGCKVNEPVQASLTLSLSLSRMQQAVCARMNLLDSIRKPFSCTLLAFTLCVVVVVVVILLAPLQICFQLSASERDTSRGERERERERERKREKEREREREREIERERNRER